MENSEQNNSPTFDSNYNKNLNELLSINDFVNYSSPRYFRLIFPEYKPKTKNGELLSALSELKISKILTSDSDWDRIKFTKKGVQYKKIIKKLIDLNYLYTKDSNGLFDYRSEQGRKVIISLIEFLSSKLNFTQYFDYLNLPIFDSEKAKDWLEIFKEDNYNEDIENQSNFNLNNIESNQLQNLQSFLMKKKDSFQRRKLIIDKKITEITRPLRLDINLIRNLFRKVGLNRPAPLLMHFNSNPEPRVFSYDKRNLYVNITELIKIKNILKEHLIDFLDDENKWLKDYFDMLKLPVEFYGFQKSDFIFSTKEVDIFLRLAVEGPKILASQYCEINELSDLVIIAFPITEDEIFIIYIHESNTIFYFTISSNYIYYNQKIDFTSSTKFPKNFRTSLKRFGKLLERSVTLSELILKRKIDIISDKEQKHNFEEELKLKKQYIKDFLERLSRISASLFTTCQAIASKISNNFIINKTICLFKNGSILLSYIDSDTILTTINIGSIEFGIELKNIIKKIDESFSEILKNDF